MDTKKKLSATAAATAIVGRAVIAQEFPAKTTEVNAHAGNGGGTNATTRMMIRARRERDGDMVVVYDRGADAAMDDHLNLDPGGNTILTFTIGHSATVALGKTDIAFDDVRPIAWGIDDVPAFMFARQGDLATPLIVPFGGGVELATQLVAGAVDVAVLNLAEARSWFEAGDICLVVVWAPERMSALTDVSTTVELGNDANFQTCAVSSTMATRPMTSPHRSKRHSRTP